MQILYIEDDLMISKGVLSLLKREGFAVQHVMDGQSALAAWQSHPADIIVLDLGLPDIDGLQVLKKIRQNSASVPVLLLTARDAVQDKVGGLDAGADDYLTKPFEADELLARLRALERRLSSTASSVIRIKEVELDTSQQIVSVNAEPVTFSRREYMLLKALMQNAGAIRSKQNLEDKLYSWGEEVASNTIEVHNQTSEKNFQVALFKR